MWILLETKVIEIAFSILLFWKFLPFCLFPCKVLRWMKQKRKTENSYNNGYDKGNTQVNSVSGTVPKVLRMWTHVFTTTLSSRPCCCPHSVTTKRGYMINQGHKTGLRQTWGGPRSLPPKRRCPPRHVSSVLGRASSTPHTLELTLTSKLVMRVPLCLLDITSPSRETNISCCDSLPGLWTVG